MEDPEDGIVIFAAAVHQVDQLLAFFGEPDFPGFGTVAAVPRKKGSGQDAS
jgi:hypothetical protein